MSANSFANGDLYLMLLAGRVRWPQGRIISKFKPLLFSRLRSTHRQIRPFFAPLSCIYVVELFIFLSYLPNLGDNTQLVARRGW